MRYSQTSSEAMSFNIRYKNVYFGTSVPYTTCWPNPKDMPPNRWGFYFR